jgi:hypothetical protein
LGRFPLRAAAQGIDFSQFTKNGRCSKITMKAS